MEVFEHQHPLTLVDLQLEQPYYDAKYDDGEEDNAHMIMKQDFRCSCDHRGQEINSFQMYYYKCTNSCDYSLHKFCAELPKTLNYISHHSHPLILIKRKQSWICNICRMHHKPQQIRYRCYPCNFDVDVNCALAMEPKRIDQPSHPHPLVSTSKLILRECNACGKVLGFLGLT